MLLCAIGFPKGKQCIFVTWDTERCHKSLKVFCREQSVGQWPVAFAKFSQCFSDISLGLWVFCLMQIIHTFFKRFSEGGTSLFLSAVLQVASSKPQTQTRQAYLFTSSLAPAELLFFQQRYSFPAHKLEEERKDIPFYSQSHKTPEG